MLNERLLWVLLDWIDSDSVNTELPIPINSFFLDIYQLGISWEEHQDDALYALRGEKIVHFSSKIMQTVEISSAGRRNNECNTYWMQAQRSQRKGIFFFLDLCSTKKKRIQEWYHLQEQNMWGNYNRQRNANRTGEAQSKGLLLDHFSESMMKEDRISENEDEKRSFHRSPTKTERE